MNCAGKNAEETAKIMNGKKIEVSNFSHNCLFICLFVCEFNNHDGQMNFNNSYMNSTKFFDDSFQ